MVCTSTAHDAAVCSPLFCVRSMMRYHDRDPLLCACMGACVDHQTKQPSKDAVCRCCCVYACMRACVDDKTNQPSKRMMSLLSACMRTCVDHKTKQASKDVVSPLCVHACLSGSQNQARMPSLLLCVRMHACLCRSQNQSRMLSVAAVTSSQNCCGVDARFSRHRMKNTEFVQNTKISDSCVSLRLCCTCRYVGFFHPPTLQSGSASKRKRLAIILWF